MEALQHLRRDEIFHTIRLIYEDKGRVVDIRRTVFCTSVNLLGKMIFSTNVFDPHNPKSAWFKNSMCEMTKLSGTPNLADFFPFLRFLDPQSVSWEMAKHLKGVYDFVDLFIQKRFASSSEILERNDSKKDFLDVLLDFRSEDLTLVDIRALITVSTEITQKYCHKFLIF
ncbi:hypothetical protein SUGI_0648770 [Cryptomeria japonica]|nr:hypothetical protein SUGI_0648770 [Cryptomeria japonica]